MVGTAADGRRAVPVVRVGRDDSARALDAGDVAVIAGVLFAAMVSTATVQSSGTFSIEPFPGWYGERAANCTKEKVCVPHYTDGVRPTSGWIKAYKHKLCAQAFPNDIDGCMATHELDHFWPLELCGAPKNPYNLSLEPWPEARKKDPEETRLHRLMCEPGSSLSPDQAWDLLQEHWRFWTPERAAQQ